MAADFSTDDTARGGGLAIPGLVVVCAFLATVWLKVHSWEAYMYAASHEGFLQLSEMFSAVHAGQALPDISRFHPYHPLFHMIVKTAWSACGGSVSALTIAVALNKMSAVAAIVLTHRIFLRLFADGAVALVAAGGMFFTKAFLFGAFSGDAHILSLALFLGALSLTLDAPGDIHDERRRALWAALLFSLGAQVNLAIFFYGLVPLAVLLRDKRLEAALIAVLVSGVLLFSMYVVVPVMLLDLRDFAAYERLFGIYSYLAHDDAPLLTRVVEFADALSAGLVGGLETKSNAARAVHGVLLAGGIMAAIAAPRASSAGTKRFWVPFWFFGFAVGELAMNTESSVNGTLYVMVPTFALMGFLLRALPRLPRRAAMLAIAAIGALNVATVVVPKASPDETGAPRLAAMKAAPPPETPVAVMLSHMSLFQEVYHLGHERRFSRFRIFLPEVTESRDALQAFVDGHGNFCLLSSTPTPSGLRSFVRTRILLSPDLYHFSVNHPDSKRMVPKNVYFACRIAALPPQGS